jgi:hypothetical protein
MGMDFLPWHWGIAGAVVLLLYAIGIYLFGLPPRCAQRLESRIIRSFKAPKRWSFTEIEPLLFLGGLPRWPSHIEELRANGVGAVLSLNETWEMSLSPTCIREDCAMVHRQLPTPDFFAPEHRDVVEAVAFIQKHIRAGVGVYVHCNGGKGRSAVCVISYLIYAYAWTADEAYDFVRLKRNIAHLKALFGLRAQWRVIKRFERQLNKSRAQVSPFTDGSTKGSGAVHAEKVHTLLHDIPNDKDNAEPDRLAATDMVTNKQISPPTIGADVEASLQGADATTPSTAPSAVHSSCNAVDSLGSVRHAPPVVLLPCPPAGDVPEIVLPAVSTSTPDVVCLTEFGEDDASRFIRPPIGVAPEVNGMLPNGLLTRDESVLT